METERVASLNSIDAVVGGGRAVVSAENSIVIAMMQEALTHGRSTVFYVDCAQAQAMWRWYWTPRRIKEIGMEVVSKDERAKIESELGIKCAGPWPWFSNRIPCPSCGGEYGMFEFMQQGLREHDRDWIKAVFELKNTSVIRVNPPLDAICAYCNELLLMGHWYGMPSAGCPLIYGCCSGP